MTTEKALKLLNRPLPKAKAKVDVCAEYKKNKALIEAARFWANLLPLGNIGKSIVRAIDILIAAADVACPVK